ncbi:MAG TPA: polysaccharide deacetylase family protein [Pyrinomonadaceae bacterium]|nr:polysaccharide deacetylase family protein [Pyrinomonadaceae bacterium]
MKVPVLAYHKIDLPTPDVKIRGAYTSPHRFEKQILYLKKRAFDFFTASELIGFYLENGRFPENAICITFDDGWKDNYANAFPILKKFNIKATIFLVPSCIGAVTAQVTADGEGEREHLSMADIREMSASGIEFGSHSMNHKLFDRIEPAEIEREVVDSRNYIEDLLQKPCEVFAYPAGLFTDFAREMVRLSGYKAAFSTVYGPADIVDRFALNRTEILRRDGLPFQFSRKIRSIFPG